MRRRSTFLYDPDADVDPGKIKVEQDALNLTSLPAAREERLTFAFNEFPPEILQVLRQCHELHIRWATEVTYQSQPPFVSRTSPGLHIFYTPATPHNSQGEPLSREAALRQQHLFCPILRKIFGTELRCSSVTGSFTAPPILSERFAHSASLQYHTVLSSLNDAVEYVQQKLCPHSSIDCIQEAGRLNSVDTLDLDFDSISHSLRLTAYWSKAPEVRPVSSSSGWTTSIRAGQLEAVEVGVLSNEPPTDPYELSLSGFLTVVGEDEKPAPTLFSFPSRHHSLPPSQGASQAYSVSFHQPTGLHPTLQISFPSARHLVAPTTRPSDSQCSLNTYLTLPSAIFPDRYELSTTDSLFLSSHNLIALRGLSGELDLEAPDYLPSLKWGSNVLLELATPSHTNSPSLDHPWNITIPLHLRYLSPSPSGQTSIHVPNPIVFWACTAEEGTKFPVNPFDRVNLGWDGLFGERTMFYQLNDHTSPGGKLIQEINVPVLQLTSDSTWTTVKMIELGTVLAVSLGFFWVLWKLFGGNSREPTVKNKDKESKSTKKTQ